MGKRLQIAGIIYDEPNEVYHANKKYDSFSNIKTLLESPELYKKTLDGLVERKEKDEWKIGNYVHCEVFETSETSLRYMIVDDSYDGRTTEGKRYKNECESRGLELLNVKNSAISQNCVKAVKSSPAMSLFSVGNPEVTFRVNCENVNFQCKTDWICLSAPAGLEQFGIFEGDTYVAELKTTQSLDEWFMDVQWKNPLTNDLFYAGQEAFYTAVINNVLLNGGHEAIDKWVFVVVEKKEPFRAAVITTPDHVKEWANNKVSAARVELTNRKKSGDWTDERLQGSHTPDIRIY